MATKPSIALIPSGYKAGTLYSVLPSNGDADFTTTRSTQATRVNKDGLIELVDANVPRLNYPLVDGVVSGCPSYLSEPASTNLIEYSEDFSQGYFNQNDGILIDSNSVISPNGTQDADKVTKTTTDIWRGLTTTAITLKPSTTYTASCFVKKGDGVSAGVNVSFDGAKTLSLNTKIVFSNETMDNREAIGSWDNTGFEKFKNGWYRVWGKFTTGTSVGSTSIGIVIDGDIISNKFNYFWGAQVEELPYATSYIPTSGSAVSRSADTASADGLQDSINSNEGVLYAEISALADDGTNRFLSISDGTTNNRVMFGYRAASNQVFSRIEGNNSASVDLTYVVNDTENVIKLAIYYDTSFNYKMYLNGFLVDNEVGTEAIIGLDRIKFSNPSNVENFYGNTKDLRVYKTALQDSELEYITSYRSFNEMATNLQYTIE